MVSYGLGFGGHSTTTLTSTEEFTGAGANIGAWATGANINTAAASAANRGNGTQGTQDAALATGGGSPAIAAVEEYNGSSWTEIADLNVAKYSAAFTDNCGNCVGGNTGSAALTLKKYGMVHHGLKLEI